jgi:hypothetical protein
MDTSKIITFPEISLKSSKEINEKYIQEYIANDPSVLGLGELILKDKERIQPNAGRLDILCQESDPDSNRRYEIELQLGKTDESHIIRTIEYWDIERKRYPQYDHCAVIIAEDITTRFLNVIQLFNGHIPLIAIQMKAYNANDKIVLIFTKILDEVKRDDIEIIPPEDHSTREYWETKGSKETVALADDILKIINEIEPNFVIQYNKHYIGLRKNGIAFNFAIMFAKKSFLRIDFKLDKNDEVEALINDNELDVLEYNYRTSMYKIRLTKNDLTGKENIIKTLMEKSYEYFN